MGEAQLPGGILTIEGRCPQARHLLLVVNRLSAAADTAAGTGHDLHKVVVDSALLQLLDQLGGIAEAVHHRHLQLRAGDFELCFLPAFITPQLPEGIRIRVLPRHEIVGRPQCRLHHAARGTEDIARTGADAEGQIQLRLGKLGRHDMLRADEPVHLAGGQHHIHIRVAFSVLHGRQGTLRLLRHAGHDGHAEDLRRIHL